MMQQYKKNLFQAIACISDFQKPFKFRPKFRQYIILRRPWQSPELRVGWEEVDTGWNLVRRSTFLLLYIWFLTILYRNIYISLLYISLLYIWLLYILLVYILLLYIWLLHIWLLYMPLIVNHVCLFIFSNLGFGNNYNLRLKRNSQLVAPNATLLIQVLF